MSLGIIVISFLVLISLAYRFYGRWVARELGLDDARRTPAHEKCDGEDFIPTKPFYLFAQHFSAIAAAGPIAGPIAACLAFGWLPALLWIALGVVLIGAVHDFTSLALSVRHGAVSIAEITRREIGSFAGRAMLIFIWIALLYIIVAFANITAGSFVSRVVELDGLELTFNPGGAVAAASIFYLLLSLSLGILQKFIKAPLWFWTVIFVPATFAVAWAGTLVSHLFIMDVFMWGVLICVYCVVASLCPVWLLLQPRGYLGGFVLYAAIGLGLIGIFFGGHEIQQPAFKSWDVGGLSGTLFPFLFVTIACGACSGFHGLVCSGTTSKQIDRESHMHPVGYGAMLCEGLVAIMALGIVMTMSPETAKGLQPGTIYGRGIGQSLTLLIGEDKLPFAITFGAMAFSTFVFDTLDVSTRLGRYLLQELLRMPGIVGAVIGTLLTAGLPALILLNSDSTSWQKFWTLFGASNQLLAALTLLTITLWLHRQRKRISFTLYPMIFVLVITLWALGKIVIGNMETSSGWDTARMNAIAAASLIVLALAITLAAVYRLYADKAARLQAGIRLS